MHRIIFAFICAAVLVFYSCSDTVSPGGEIKIDQDRLNSAFTSARNSGRIKCLIVSYKDNIYKSEYFLSNAQTQTQDIMSVTKSVSSLLIGIAIDKGFIPSVDVPIDSYIRPLVPDLDSAKGRITVRQLLTMSDGLEWSQMPGPSEFMQWMTAPDRLLYILNKPIVTVPGKTFNYSDGAAHLISVVLSRATNMTAKEFAQRYLFDPLGISSRNWTADNRGFNYGGVRLFLYPEDMVKIGMLVLKKGKWGSEQVVSENWINESTSFHIATGDVIPYGSGYGYYWWRSSANNYNFFYGNGYGGQFIVVVPEYELVVVGTTNWSGLNEQQTGELWYTLMSIIVNQVMTSFHR